MQKTIFFKIEKPSNTSVNAQQKAPDGVLIDELAGKKIDFITLTQLLKITDCATSGGEAHALIESGQVRCNGLIDCRKRLKLRAGDVVEVGNYSITLLA